MKLLAVAVLSVALTPAAQAQDFAGTARAVDGDTVVVGERRVRVFGIDAPEYRQTCKVGWSNWSCGADAATAMRAMVDGRQLSCTPVDRDVYGRTVATCRAGSTDVAAAMLAKGLAIALDNAPGDYAALAGQSKSRQAGIWASEFETPAAYRAAHPRSDAVPAAPARAVPAAGRAPGTAAAFAYRNCAQARAAGAAPIRAGQPGYGPHLDRDGDGIACEPYRGR